MIRFTIYTYLFKPINEPQEPDMFSPEVKVDESLAMKQELLGELFKAESKLRFSRSRNNGDGESKQFEHMIVAQSEGIIVMLSKIKQLRQYAWLRPCIRGRHG